MTTITTKAGNEYVINERGEGMYSVSWGFPYQHVQGGQTVTTWVKQADSWSDWHLIPPTRHSISEPAPTFKFIDVPGSTEMLDLSGYLTGKLEYGRRTGTLTFLVDPESVHWAVIYKSMCETLHGKKLGMRLTDDPNYYYEGYFTVGDWETGETNSTVSVSYQLNPYKIRIDHEGDTEIIWDTFNFDVDRFEFPRGGSAL
jgi:hypothetical protein